MKWEGTTILTLGVAAAAIIVGMAIGRLRSAMRTRKQKNEDPILVFPLEEHDRYRRGGTPADRR